MKATVKIWGSEKVTMVMFCLLNKQGVFGLEKVAYFDLRQVFRSMEELENVGVTSFCGLFRDESDEPYLELTLEGPESVKFHQELESLREMQVKISKIENALDVTKNVPKRVMAQIYKKAGIKRPLKPEQQKKVYCTLEVVR